MKDILEKEEPTAARPEPAVAVAAHLPRRALFGTGLLSAFGLLAQACSSDMADFGGAAIGRKRSDKPQGGAVDGNDEPLDICNGLEAEERRSCLDQTSAGSDGPLDLPPESDTDDADCRANVTNEVDLTNLPVAAGDLKPRVVFYGRRDSTLIAMKWTSDRDLGHILITTPEGRLLALHGITGADKDGSGQYRPIVVDNLWLRSDDQDLAEIRIVIQTPAGSFVHVEPIVYLQTRDAKPVVDLGNGGAVAANVGQWSVTKFAENGGFDYDASLQYPGPTAGTPRGLNTAMSTSQWEPDATGIKGEITDIMGDTIPGLSGGAILEYQVFCTYVLSGGSYYRTILHIG